MASSRPRAPSRLEGPAELMSAVERPPKRVEKTVQYSGVRTSSSGFFTQFEDIIFRWHGSVIPYTLVELTISIALGFLAMHTS